MKMTSFRIRRFRCVRDTGSVAIQDVTALVGRNESGKTALLEALLLLNEDAEINDVDRTDGLDSSGPTDNRIAQATFELTGSEREQVTQIAPELPAITTITIYRESDGGGPNYEYSFQGGQSWEEVRQQASKDLSVSCLQLITAVSRWETDETKRQHDATRIIITDSDHTDEGDKTVPASEAKLAAQDVISKLADDSAPQQDAKEAIAALVETLGQPLAYGTSVDVIVQTVVQHAKRALNLPEQMTAVDEIISEKMRPRFMYFSDYSIIEGMIRLPDYMAAASGKTVTKLESGERLDKRETIENLFAIAALDPKYLSTFVSKPAQKGQYLRTCSMRLTRALQATWLSQKVEVEIRHDGDLVQVWVSDLHEGGVRTNTQLLQRRSYGFRWYFSFLVNFRAATGAARSGDAILLLDEPGLHLHPAQQGGLQQELQGLAATHQILYSTHSPFMLMTYKPSSLLLLETDKETHLSVVRERLWDGDIQTSIPVLHALGAKQLLQLIESDLARALPAILVVEGDCDFWYVKTVSYLLTKRMLSDDAETKPDQADVLWDVELSQANGSPGIALRCLFHQSQGYRVVALYDNEPDARRYAEDLRNAGFPDRRIVFVEVSGKDEADIEDIFSEKEYLQAVNDFYTGVLKKTSFSKITKDQIKAVREQTGIKRLVPALESVWSAHASDSWGQFDKVKVCHAMCKKLIEGNSLAKDTQERFSNLFRKIKQALRDEAATE